MMKSEEQYHSFLAGLLWFLVLCTFMLSCVTVYGLYVVESRVVNLQKTIIVCNKDTVDCIKDIYKTEKQLIENVKIYENAFLKDIIDAKEKQKAWVSANKEGTGQ